MVKRLITLSVIHNPILIHWNFHKAKVALVLISWALLCQPLAVYTPLLRMAMNLWMSFDKGQTFGMRAVLCFQPQYLLQSACGNGTWAQDMRLKRAESIMIVIVCANTRNTFALLLPLITRELNRLWRFLRNHKRLQNWRHSDSCDHTLGKATFTVHTTFKCLELPSIYLHKSRLHYLFATVETQPASVSNGLIQYFRKSKTTCLSATLKKQLLHLSVFLKISSTMRQILNIRWGPFQGGLASPPTGFTI